MMNVQCHAYYTCIMTVRVWWGIPPLCLFITYLSFPLLRILGNHMSGGIIMMHGDIPHTSDFVAW